jgi:hypothetical protein
VILEHYQGRNALGVYSHPHALPAHLAEARKAIARAEEIIRNAQCKRAVRTVLCG